jgi:hypothetical protein
MRQLCAVLTLAVLAISFVVHGRVVGETPMDLHKAETTRFDGAVAVWYGSHFEDSAKHDWEPIKEWNGPFHPVLGEYKTDDREVVRQHLQWLRRAGVDVIFYDACRIQPEKTLLDLGKQKTLQVLAEELSHQEKETRKLKLVVWLEKWNSNPTAEQYEFGFDYIRKNLADRDFYFRLEGKPLVMSYLNGPAPDHAAIEKRNESFFAIRHIASDATTPGWRYIGPAGDKECMTVNPGFDPYMEGAFMTKYVNKQSVDDAALREHRKAAFEQRADGKLFETQLLKAREVNPKVIFISGWNDWACCLQIEPAKEYGFKYVDMAARLLGREAETLPYRKPQ